MGSKVPPSKFLKAHAPEGHERVREADAVSVPDAAAQGDGSLYATTPVAPPRSRDAEMLRMIAETLGMSPSAFLSPSAFTEPGMSGPQTSPEQEAAGECGELIRAYLRIRDPNERRRYLALIRSAGNRA
jgi:hypothetical protein